MFGPLGLLLRPNYDRIYIGVAFPTHERSSMETCQILEVHI